MFEVTGDVVTARVKDYLTFVSCLYATCDQYMD